MFHENKKVLEKLDRFIKTHVDIISPKEKVISDLNSDLNDLVLEMARDLGYTEIDNNVMKSFYYPDASWNRHLSDSIYSELYSLQNFPILDGARKQKAEQQKNQQPPQVVD